MTTADGSADFRPFASWPEAIYWSIAIAMAVAFVAILVLAALDARTIDGHVSVWAKPLKFAASLALHSATLAIVVASLGLVHRHGTAMLVVAVAFLAACTVEIGYIFFQAARAEASHFNVGTPFHSAMYSVMAFCAVIIVGSAGAVGAAALADRNLAASAALKAAIVLGFVGGTILTLITAFAIGARMSPYIGGVPAFDARMALTGWSRSGGDLRVSHFLATHMIQAVPVFALIADRVLARRAAFAAVVAFALIWTMATLSEFRLALGGAPSFIAGAMS